MAGVVKWLRPRIVVPICVGSNPISRPILRAFLYGMLYLYKEVNMSRLSERIENYNKAYSFFTDAVEAYNNDKTVILSHFALIQTYEVCFELAWKVLKDYLFINGINASMPREVIKEAFAANVIKDGQLWIDMLNDRNSVSYEFRIDKINVITEKISSNYFDELTNLAKHIVKV